MHLAVAPLQMPLPAVHCSSNPPVGPAVCPPSAPCCRAPERPPPPGLPALAAESIGNAIKNLYNAVEPWVQYGFNLTAWAVGWLPYIGILAPQINFFYYLGEPIVQAVLFNAIDFVDGTVTFSQALTNIETATAASINQFINTEINWIRGFLPPLPPISPPGFPSLP